MGSLTFKVLIHKSGQSGTYGVSDSLVSTRCIRMNLTPPNRECEAILTTIFALVQRTRKEDGDSVGASVAVVATKELMKFNIR